MATQRRMGRNPFEKRVLALNPEPIQQRIPPAKKVPSAPAPKNSGLGTALADAALLGIRGYALIRSFF
jgi:hypothetical protein